jgi:hypothetical protein
VDDWIGIEHKSLHRGIEDEQKVVGNTELGNQSPVFNVETGRLTALMAT